MVELGGTPPAVLGSRPFHYDVCESCFFRPGKAGVFRIDFDGVVRTMNPVPFNSVALEMMMYSTLTLLIGVVGIFICMVLLDILGTRKRD
jgi:hypothetical protein